MLNHAYLFLYVTRLAVDPQVLNWLPEGQFPGSVLIKLALGSLEEFSETEAHWKAEALKLRERTSYMLRVHVYQVRLVTSRQGVKTNVS